MPKICAKAGEPETHCMLYCSLYTDLKKKLQEKLNSLKLKHLTTVLNFLSPDSMSLANNMSM